MPPAAESRCHAPKLYAADTGLAAFLTGHRDAEVLWHGPMRGALFETLVINEVRRYFSHRGDSPWLYYWRSSDGLEVDCVIEARGGLQAIEVKSNATPMPRMGDELRKWRHTLGERAGRSVLICDCERKRSIGGGIEAIPWRRTSELLDSLAST